MLNPFMLDPHGKWRENSRPASGQRHAQEHAALMKPPVLPNRNQLTLRLGNLLIRMGKELTGESAFQEGVKAAWSSDQAKTRPARFHHA